MLDNGYLDILATLFVPLVRLWGHPKGLVLLLNWALQARPFLPFAIAQASFNSSSAVGK